MIKKTTRKLSNPHDWVGKHFGGLAQATKDGRWFHVDAEEKPIYRQRYDWVSPFHRGRSLVRKNNGYFTIRTDGTIANSRP